MKTNIIKNIIDTSKLNEEIHKFEIITMQKAYLFMNSKTIECIMNPIFDEKSKYCLSGFITEFKGNKVYIDDDLKFGEVEIR